MSKTLDLSEWNTDHAAKLHDYLPSVLENEAEARTRDNYAACLRTAGEEENNDA